MKQVNEAVSAVAEGRDADVVADQLVEGCEIPVQSVQAVGLYKMDVPQLQAEAERLENVIAETPDPYMAERLTDQWYEIKKLIQRRKLAANGSY